MYGNIPIGIYTDNWEVSGTLLKRRFKCLDVQQCFYFVYVCLR